ncbi:MAG: T9SS type A sorting domain-containing protein [Bacteroidia bacterium]
MKTQLLKSIFFYLLSSIFYLQKVSAQIVYTNIIPDTLINTNNESYDLDLNNDAIKDFVLGYTSVPAGCFCFGFYSGKNYARVSPLQLTNGIVISGGYPSDLSVNTVIENSLNWNNASQQILVYQRPCCVNQNGGIQVCAACYSGNWHTPTGPYLGLKFEIAGSIHFGWARLSIQINSAKFTIRDYAYNSIPNQPILAGQTTITGVNEIVSNEPEQLSVYPNPATNSVTIKFPSDEAGEIQIVNLFGQIVFTEKINSEEKTIDVINFLSGMYVVRWNNGKNFEAKIFSVIK